MSVGQLLALAVVLVAFGIFVLAVSASVSLFKENPVKKSFDVKDDKEVFNSHPEEKQDK